MLPRRRDDAGATPPPRRYHSHMGHYLTYHGNAKFDGDAHPDENYAREIMQLFSIGLYELDEDGTPEYASETYTNEDIVSFARAWTGFRTRDNRGNVERGDTSGANHVNRPRGISLRPSRRRRQRTDAAKLIEGGRRLFGFGRKSRIVRGRIAAPPRVRQEL